MSFALFGPEETRWTQESLSSLQSTLLQNTHVKFLTETLARLPSLWPTLEKHYEPFNSPGHERLQQLSDFAVGKTIPDPKSLYNIHLAPLTIIKHVVDFVCMANEVDIRVNTGQALRLPSFEAVQGFCIGFLSAAAVSSSSNWAEFERNVSNALRLAVCIGAVIDVEDALHNPADRAVAISVRWKTDSARAYLEASLDLFPDVSRFDIPSIKRQ